MGYFVPELGYQEYYLAKEHVKMGHDVYVVSSDMFYPFPNIENMLKEAGIKETSRQRKAGYSEYEGIKIYRLPHFFEFIDLIFVKGVKKTLEEIKPDVVFAHESRQGLPALAAKYKDKLGYRLVVDQHDFYHDIPYFPRYKKILRKLDYFLIRNPIVKYNFKKADKIVAVTEQTKNYLNKTFKIPKQKLSLIPLGVDTDIYHYSEDGREEIRQRYSINKSDIVLIFAGTVVRRKRVELLIRSFSEIKNNGSRLIICGGGEKDYMKELKDLANKLNIKEKVTFTGFVNKKELPYYFSASDVGIWPGNNSVIIMEAMACRLPIIMVDLQLTHLVKYGNGFSFKEDDKEELKKHMQRLIEDTELRKKMSKNSYDGVIKDFSYKEIAKKFLELV